MFMLHQLKSFLLRHEPFRPAHMGKWIRGRYFRHYLRKYVPPEAVRRILDGGCGNGIYVREVAQTFPDAEIFAVDIKIFSEWETNRPQNVVFKALDLRTYNERDMRDLVYSIDVLEHIIGNEVVLRNFFTALRPGGYLYLAVPCEDAQRFVLPKKWFGEFYEWADDEHVGEMRHLPELIAVMKTIGYEIVFSRTTFTFFGHLAWEIEFLLHRSAWGKKINVALMPLYKLLGIADICFCTGGGHNLVVARKPPTAHAS